MTAESERADVLRQIEALERRFREEGERHNAKLGEMRDELHRLMERGDALGVSITSMAKAMSVSRGRLKADARRPAVARVH